MPRLRAVAETLRSFRRKVSLEITFLQLCDFLRVAFVSGFLQCVFHQGRAPSPTRSATSEMVSGARPRHIKAQLIAFTTPPSVSTSVPARSKIRALIEEVKAMPPSDVLGEERWAAKSPVSGFSIFINHPARNHGRRDQFINPTSPAMTSRIGKTAYRLTVCQPSALTIVPESKVAAVTPRKTNVSFSA